MARIGDDMFLEQTPCCSNVTPECYGQCTADERMIRRIIAGDHTDPLTPEQRQYLIEEADRAGEGAYPAEEAKDLTDAELAKWTLNAWADYVRSNCL